MLTPSALFWTQVSAAVGWLLVALMVRSLWKIAHDTSARRTWSVTQGMITASKAGASPTHPTRGDVADTGIIVRYRYRVGDKDYEGDGTRIGGKSRAMGLLAKALLKKFPEGRPVDVFYDPQEPARSALERKGKGSATPVIVFLVVFAAITAVLTAHAIAGKMLVMSNGLPYFALLLPTAALLVSAGAIAAYTAERIRRRAAASWPTTAGKIVSARVVEEREERDSDERRDGEGDADIFYRPDIRFSYRIGGNDYTTDTWKPGASVGYGDPAPAEATVARYKPGQTVTVHYDPTHPDTAVLEPANAQGAGVVLTAGIVFGLAGVLFMWVMTHGHWVQGG
jgi:hypothetical protein